MRKQFAVYLRSSTSLLVLCAVLLPVHASFGQADSTSDDELIEQWMTTVHELNKLRFRHRLSEDKEKTAIEREFNVLMEKARELEPTVAVAVEARYRKDPTNQRALEPIFVARAKAALAANRREEAVRLVTLLIESGCKDPEVYAVGVQLALVSGQKGLAETWIQKAEERKIGGGNSKIFLSRLREPIEHQTKEDEIRAKQHTAGEADESKRLPRVKLETSEGDMVLELCEEEAPNTVANFVSLVDKGFYDGLKFHRIEPGFMAQGGDPKGDGTGGPGYRIPCECHQPNFRRHFRGSLSMAHSGKNTGGSQFFLTFAPTPHLDGKHTVFGYVVEGFDTLDKLEELGTSSGTPAEEPVINKATVLNKRDHEYEVKKVGEK